MGLEMQKKELAAFNVFFVIDLSWQLLCDILIFILYCNESCIVHRLFDFSNSVAECWLIYLGEWQKFLADTKSKYPSTKKTNRAKKKLKQSNFLREHKTADRKLKGNPGSID